MGKRVDEFKIDAEITRAKAVVCIREYKRTLDLKWLCIAENHLRRNNRLLEEMERRFLNIADPVDWIGAERFGT